MKEKDITEKILESHADVFADIVNVLLYDGERRVAETELEERSEKRAYKSDGHYHDLERDVSKLWKRKELHLASIGMENQSKVDRDMPLRVMGSAAGTD